MKQKDINVGLGHYHEMVDRIHCLTESVDNLLSSHPVALAHPKFKKKLDKMISKMYSLYHEASIMMFDANQTELPIKKAKGVRTLAERMSE